MEGSHQWSAAVPTPGMNILRIHPVNLVSRIPPLFFLCSALYLLLCKVNGAARDYRHEGALQNSANTNPTSSRTSAACSFKMKLKGVDGLHIAAFEMARLACCITLLILHAVDPSNMYDASTKVLMTLLFLYTSVLSASAIFSAPFWRDFYSRQVSIVLFSEYAIYFYLDIWPLCTVDKGSSDPPSAKTFWPRLIALTIGAVVIPLLMPRPFRPSSKAALPDVEDTASIISRYTFSYIQNVVFLAYKAQKISVEELPQISDKRTADHLSSKVFKYLDPMLVGRNQHFFWGMLRGFRWSYIKMAILILAESVTSFAGAYGMKNLLLYVERGDFVYGARPWVWILVLALGPFFSSMFQTHFMSYSTRQVAETESVITQLVFEHSLRIRMGGNMIDENKRAMDAADANNTPGSSSDVAAVEATESIDDKAETDEGNELLGETEDNAHRANEKQDTKHLIGKINSLVTTDLLDVTFLQNLMRIPAAFIQTCIAIAFLHDLMGWSAFVGLAAMIVLFPIPAKLSKVLVRVIKETKMRTDKRVQLASESLGVLRMIKLFAWEPFLHRKLGEVRKAEMKQIRFMRLLEIGINGVSELLPLVAKIVVFALYALVMKKDLSASIIFSALLVFSILEENLWYMLQMLPEALKSKVTYDRYTEFLNATELLPSASRELETSIPLNLSGDKIGFNKCIFSWDRFGSQQDGGRHRFKLTFGDEVVFRCGVVNLILGPTASGKTSVLMALLGEMYYRPLGPDSWHNLPRGGGVAYAAQESWVLNETIRTNILFGEAFDKDRYNKVIKQCALEQDLSLWSAGDMTEVGEKGLTLSGGQKARLTLARALYSPASIVLLDDVLAALDVHTAKHVVNHAFQGDLVRGRTVLLVTHNIALAAPIAENVLLLGRNGKVVRQGTVADVLQTSTKLREEIEKQRKLNDEIEKTETKETGTDDVQDITTSGKLIVAEEKAVGKLEFAAVMMYLRACGNPMTWTFALSLIYVSIILSISQTWFVGMWSSQYEDRSPSEINVIWYFSIYAAIASSAMIVGSGRRAYFIIRATKASEVIHYQLLDSVLKAPFRWLDVTPAGRILTRFTQDIGSIDGWLPYVFTQFIYTALLNASLFVVTVSKAGLYALVPGLLLITIGGFLSNAYLKAQINLKREMNLRKAPVISQLGVALAGLQSIRAYDANSFFRLELNNRLNEYVRVSLAFYDLNRWLSVRLDFLGAVFSGTVTAYLVYKSSITAGSVGFILSLVLAFSRSILEVVRWYNRVEQHANSLERVLDYMRIDHEPGENEGINPPAYWPTSGHLRVERLSAKYSDESPEVLKDISFEIRAGDRIGVVGRTGAGKSTIALALLRAIKTSGKVFYDGLAIDEMPLHVLRSKITVIPQQPELIRGTLRENLDPYEECDDAFLNYALRASQLHNVNDLHVGNDRPEELAPSAQSETSIGLDTSVESGGTNFSMGQRQIIALARAIVRKSKLIILDEATAAIDYATDAAIQTTLRTEFGKDITMITIAHRLHTIMDYDKIMVLDAGRLVEFDSPKDLLSKDGGLFRALVDESDDSEALKAMLR